MARPPFALAPAYSTARSPATSGIPPPTSNPLLSASHFPMEEMLPRVLRLLIHIADTQVESRSPTTVHLLQEALSSGRTGVLNGPTPINSISPCSGNLPRTSASWQLMWDRSATTCPLQRILTIHL